MITLGNNALLIRDTGSIPLVQGKRLAQGEFLPSAFGVKEV
jgi:hypothetical protein